MKSLISLMLYLVCCYNSRASEININKLVWAIGKAENSTKYPYGIKSYNVRSDKELGRKICFNTCKNNLRRWKRAGSRGEFINFLAKVYCPLNDPNDSSGLNSNWIKNVNFYLNKTAN